MTHAHRIFTGPDVGDILDSIESLPTFARDHAPGRYDVDEHSLDSFAGSKVSAGVSGKVIHQMDGLKILEPVEWES
jgi:hypothetical protein